MDMKRLKDAVNWFLSGFTFRFGYFWDTDYFELGVSCNKSYVDYAGDIEPSSLNIYLGFMSVYVQGKQ